ncbi:ROK family protein [Hephaestia sp. GCM10023244]|uniref:ROK family protein n=1 Tax=unclassified Hephaestia TaxID=2631281 RepID=UPI0020779147|nr:ROK family protein [Hephaestia sp. MAHUQ-44]MCM8729540.1 ROK family protein [Hephaestia sp. MAHUQ-44]
MSIGTTALPLVGIELGGTKCVCVLGHGPDAVIVEERVPTTIPAETLPAIRALLDRWYADYGFRAVGIASFGPVDLHPGSPTYGFIKITSKPHWAETDVAGALGGGFGVPVGFDTDVNAAALAEMRWGTGRGLADFAYMTVGTGIGVGLIVGGRPTRGIGHSELGHVRVPRFAGDDFASVCPFHADCVEGLASGSAIKARIGARHLSAIAPDDPVWAPVVDSIATLCHALVCATGPLRIAIGGGVSGGQPHLLPRIEAALIESLHHYLTLPEGPYIVAPALGGQAGPMGALVLAEQAVG